ncbi:Rv0518 family GDSL lipase [Mycolicibacterium sp. F2034L]|uniref:Rv0518 family GDSL lipase n=1 Tax=Mycolicibacterium sp. F2034L TaxID=2926422 RepID=UPI001FF2E063|nr:GDSL lipase [Mycolicibacterium sp. F2034L]MCK0174178.1 SGNH/GDSL hydrolase family protein [Mycolicibacterium sp. F2034L]
MSRLCTLLLSIALVVGAVGGHTARPRTDETVTLQVSVSRVAVISDSYTTGSSEGGEGDRGWTTWAWQTLARNGVPVAADVAAEGGAGYATRGNRGNVFEDLAARAINRDDDLVVFFGSRNDERVEPTALTFMVYGLFQMARRMAPAARFLVIGPAWPTADPPPPILRIRDTLAYQAKLAKAEFVDPIAERWFVDQPHLIGADGVHPTDEGHVYMADKIAPLIAARLLRHV